MPLEKQSATFNFAQGMSTFEDVNQLPLGKFVSLQNGVFVGTNEDYGRLQKRNGYGLLATLPDGSSTYITTFGGSLAAIGNQNLKAYSQGPNTWQTIGNITNITPIVTPGVKNNANQSSFDVAISPNGLACFSYIDTLIVGSGTSQAVAKYCVIDATTGQNVIQPTAITALHGSASFTQNSRVFSIGSNFAIFYGSSLNSASGFLEYFTINQSTLAAGSPTAVASNYLPRTLSSASTYAAFDGVVASGTLFLAWYTSSSYLQATSGQIVAASFTPTFTMSPLSVISTASAVNMITVCADTVGPNPASLFIGWTDASGGVAPSPDFSTQSIHYASTDFSFTKNFPPSLDTNNSPKWVNNIASFASNGTASFYVEVESVQNLNASLGINGQSAVNTYRSQIVNRTGISGVSPLSNIALDLGLASKPFAINGSPYLLTTFQSTYQSSYFVVNSAGQILGKLSYGNGGGWLSSVLPNVSVVGSTAYVGYLNKNTVTSVNKNTNVSSQTQTVGIYSQTGIDLAKLNFLGHSFSTIETASNLHISGGQLWHYDGSYLSEHNFHLFPEPVYVGSAGSGGTLPNQSFFYVSCYKYTDARGNIFRSAPSIPVNVNTAGSGGLSTSINTIYVPGLSITSKNTLPVSIEIYRWSNLQQNYYLVTSLQNYTGGGSYVSYADTLTDAQILGNTSLYTNGGVVEDIGAPAPLAMTMFDARLWLIDAEDPNLLWYSKPVIEATPVEMSDLFTFYVPPNTATGTPTGPMTSIAPMDDKLIIFKANTIYYINGTGPDNTGANSQYSQPIFVTSGVGCSNQNSIVLTPMGLMFQSNKGIWLLKRDLSVEYIGKEVDLYNSNTVLSACLIPGTNHVRFTLSGSVTLMYDYLVGQWGTFVASGNGQLTGLNGISATIYNGLHTYLDNGSGNVFQETPNVYSDNGVATVMQFQTGFINLTNLQGYARAYRAYLLGQYKTGNTYTLGIGYDYNSSILQTATVTPTNTAGSGSQVEQWQVNFQRQQCQSFQLTFQEVSSGTAGAGLTLSGVNLVYGAKKTYPRNLAPQNRTS